MPMRSVLLRGLVLCFSLVLSIDTGRRDGQTPDGSWRLALITAASELRPRQFQNVA
jgi:hypothetical protein